MNTKPAISPAPFALTLALSLTMTSREIAELTGKRHPDVTRDIEKMLLELGEDARSFAHIYLDRMNRDQMEYRLDRELTETLLTGYSAVLRRKVIARWRELEHQAVHPAPVPAALSRMEILTLALESEKRAVEAEEQLKLAAPAIAHLQAVQSSKDDFTFQEMANILQEYGYRLGRNRLMDILRRAGVLTNASNLPMQNYRERGYFRVVESIRKSSRGRTHVDLTTYVTGKGHNWLTKAMDTLLLKSEKMGGAT